MIDVDSVLSLSIVESDSVSICSDGPDQRKVFDPSVAVSIDEKLCYEDAISLVFLAVEKLNTAHEMAKNAEKNEKNQVWDKLGIMFILYETLRSHKKSSWTPIVPQSLYQIGYYDVLQDYLEVDLDRDLSSLETAQNITPIRRILYELCEALDDSDQEALFQQLKSRHGSLVEAKVMETVMLQLLREVPRENICILIKESIEAMQNINLKDVFSRRSCGLETCSFHAEGPRASLDFFQPGPGMCIIINQKNFKEMSNFDDRLGSDRDKEQLVLTFGLLGAGQQMLVYDDLSDTEIRSNLEAAARLLNQNHKSYAWVAVIILSHGLMKNGEDAIVGVNGHSVLVDDIRDTFSATRIPEFQDKPKLFWFQACRVNDSNEGGGASGYNYPSTQTVSTDAGVPSVNQKPTLINQMVHSATIPKHNAYRNTMDGSFFIQNLCEVFQKHAAEMTLDMMAKKVNSKVVGHNPQYQSMPEYKHTLTKEFRFEITEENKARFEQEKRRKRYQ